jgi:autotransporter-associated beta strand protein
MGAGTLSYNGTAATQAMAGLTVNPGLSVVNNASTTKTLALGAIARNAGGMAGFNSGTSGTITTSTANTNGILGPWATYGSGTSLGYACASGGAAPYSIAACAYTGPTTITSGLSGLTDSSGTVDYTMTSSGGTLGQSVSANTLRLAATAAATNINTGAYALSLNGIMNNDSQGVSISSGSGGSLTIGAAQELVFTGPGNTTVGSPIVDNAGGASALTMAGSGTLILAATNTYTGVTTLLAGTLQLGTGTSGQDGAIASASNITDNTLVAYKLTGSQTYGGTISGPGGVSMGGTGTLLLTATNTYKGGTTLSGGTLQANAAGALGTGNVTVSGGTLTENAANALNGGATQALSISGGTVTLGQANNYTGGTTVQGSGTLYVNNAAALGTGLLTIAGIVDATVAGVTLNNNPQYWASNDVTFGGTNNLNLGTGAVSLGTGCTVTVNANTITVGGVIGNGSNAYGLTKAGAGTLTLTATNTYKGGTTVSAGALAANAAGALGTGNVTVQGGTLTESIANALTGGQALVVSGGTVTLSQPNNYGGGTTAGGTLAANAAGALGTGTVTVGGGTLTESTANALTGSQALVVSGGTAALSQSNNYTGGTTLSAGMLNINNAGALGTGALVINANGSGWATNIDNTSGNAITLINNNAQGWNVSFTFGGSNALNLGTGAVTLGGNYTLTTNGSSALTVGGPIGDGGHGYRLTKAGSGTLILTGANTYSGGTSIAGGTLNVSADAALGHVPGSPAYSIVFTGNGTLQAGGPFTISATREISTGYSTATIDTNGNTLTVPGTIVGSGGLCVTGSGTLILSGANTYSGGTSLSTGTLQANAVGALGAGIVNFSGGTLTEGVDNALTGSAGLSVSGGTLTLGRANNNHGGSTLSGGTLNINNPAALGTGLISISGGAIDATVPGVTLNNNPQNWSGSFAFVGSNSLNLGAGAVTMGNNVTLTVNANTLTVGGVITGNGSYNLTKAGGGTLALNWTSNGDWGDMFITAGTVQANAAGALGYGAVTVSGGVLTESVANALGIWEEFTVSGGTAILSQPNTFYPYGYNPYQGTTTVSGGKLVATNTTGSATGNGTVTVSGSGILAGGGILSGPVSVLAGGTVSPGDAGVVGTLTLGSGTSVTFSGGSTLAVDVGAGAGNADLLVIGGAATVNTGANISFNLLGTPDQGKYVLATATSGLIGSAGAFTSSAMPAGYHLISSDTELDLSHRPTLGTATATPAAPSIIVGGSTAVTVSVQNAAPGGGDTLNFTAAPTANMTGTASGTAAAGSASGPTGGLSFSGTGLGTCQGTFTVSDPNATNSPQTGTVTVTVLDHSNASLSPTANQTTQTIDFGNVLRGATVPGQAFTIYNRAANTTAANTANLQLAGFTASGDVALSTNLSTFGGLAAGGGNTYTASLDTSSYTTTGSKIITMSAAQLADDSSLPGASGNNNGAITVTLLGNVGNATADRSNSQSSFGSLLTAPVAPNGSYANLESTAAAATGSGGSDLVGSTATILAGSNASGSAQTVAMQWRTRAQADAGADLVSDVVSLGGMTLGGTSQTSPFVLQMGYNPALLAGGAGGEGTAAAEGLIYLAWLDPGDGQWENAVRGNVGGSQLSGVGCQLGPWPGNDMTVGDWGVNTANHTVWAVLDHNSQFAVVPEPGTLALAAAAVFSLQFSVFSCRRGRRRGEG